MDIWNFPYLIHVKKGAFMKKMRWFGKFCCAFATMALASLSMVGCDLEVDDKDNRVSEAGYAPVSLEVSGQTTAFTVGDSFTLGSGVVTATYADSTTDSPHTADVTSDVVQSGFDSSKVADSLPVTLSYTKAGVTVKTEYNVKITNAVKSIALKSGDSLYSFAAGGSYYVFGKSTAKMVVTYIDDAIEEVSASEAAFSDVTNTNVKLTYKGKSVDVSLTEKTLSGLCSEGYIAQLCSEGYIAQLSNISSAGENVAFYTVTGTGDGYTEATHSMNVGFARDAGHEYTIKYATLNGTAFVTSDTTVNTGFLNDPTACSVHTTTATGDFTIYALADFSSVSCTAAFGPWNLVIADTVNPGKFGWVARPDYFGFDPLPSYPTVTYTGPSNYSDDASVNGTQYNGKFVLFKITGTQTTVKEEVFILEY